MVKNCIIKQFRPLFTISRFYGFIPFSILYNFQNNKTIQVKFLNIFSLIMYLFLYIYTFYFLYNFNLHFEQSSSFIISTGFRISLFLGNIAMSLSMLSDFIHRQKIWITLSMQNNFDNEVC